MRAYRPLIASSILALLGPGCGSTPLSAPQTARERLLGVGIELVSESEARVPPAETGRCLPIRVIPGFQRPVLPDHPAGYLIVGVERRAAVDAEEILRAVAAARPGEPLELTVRRNPYVEAGSEWWEAELTVKFP
jgi:S1-C subfamily serine protease